MNFNTEHIVILTPGFAASEEDTTTIPAMQVYLKTFKELHPNIKITIISLQFPFTTQVYNWNGITVIPLNGKNSKIKKLFIWQKTNRILNTLNLENPISALHSFWIGECAFLGDKFAKKNNLKHIITAMGQDVYKKNRYAFHLRKSKIITLSQNHHDLLLANHNLSSEIIPWFIDGNSFPDLKENKINILGVGSLNKIKNYCFFIEVIKEIVKKKPEIKVEIIGEGEKYHAINQLIKTYELQNTIKLIGKLPRNKVLEKMSESEILLHTSTYESFGFVFVEALYSGMNIVSYDVGTHTSIPKWKKCNSKELFISNCLHFLNNQKTEKQRYILYDEKDSLKAYLNIYNE